MTVLTVDGTHPAPGPGTLVEFRSPDGAVLGRYKLTDPDPLEREMDISLEEFHRRLDDPNTVWYTADELAAKLRELRCSP